MQRQVAWARVRVAGAPRQTPALIDGSYANAGAHLLQIHDPERRLSAEQVCARPTGMCLLPLATVTADQRPLVGPVDGIFYRGSFYFGSAPDSIRFRHIRARPQVSDGPEWEHEFLDSGSVYARIEAERGGCSLLDAAVVRAGPQAVASPNAALSARRVRESRGSWWR